MVNKSGVSDAILVQVVDLSAYPGGDSRVWRCRICSARGEWAGFGHEDSCVINALAAAQAEIAALKDAVERLAGGYDVLCEYGVIPAQYVDEARALADEARALLAPEPQGSRGGEG